MEKNERLTNMANEISRLRKQLNIYKIKLDEKFEDFAKATNDRLLKKQSSKGIKKMLLKQKMKLPQEKDASQTPKSKRDSKNKKKQSEDFSMESEQGSDKNLVFKIGLPTAAISDFSTSKTSLTQNDLVNFTSGHEQNQKSFHEESECSLYHLQKLNLTIMSPIMSEIL
eukprot:403355695